MSEIKLNTQFAGIISQYNQLSKVFGISVDSRDENATLFMRFRHHWVYVFQMSWLYPAVAGKIVYFIKIITEGRGLLEFSYITPCLTECFLGMYKSYCLIAYANHIHDIINSLTKIHLEVEKNYFTRETCDYVNKSVVFMNKLMIYYFIFNILLVSTFGVGPLSITATKYFTHGVTQLELPFLISYPFNARDIYIWPFVFIHQIWAGTVAVLALTCADITFFLFCTFLHIQFYLLHKQLAHLKFSQNLNTGMRSHFLKLVKRHKEILRCVDLVETIYSKSMLMNMTTSSLLICLTGFNVTVLKDLAILIPFLSFLSASMSQVFLMCYFGDLIRRSSENVSDAIYNCQWYAGGAQLRKHLLIMMIRAQKPCHITAFGFAEVNLNIFRKILSSSWSYFALLKTMYNK